MSGVGSNCRHFAPQVKITDFGSARLCEPDELLVKSVGTPAFMAPEMCAGQPFNGFKGEASSGPV